MTDFQNPMPWLDSPWQRMTGRVQSGKFPHALLVVAGPGVGKTAFASALAAYLLCEQSGRSATRCGTCKQCELLDGESHPDRRWYRPEKSRFIKVDQVRTLSEFAVASPQVARRKVIVVDRADQMNQNAANALLKTLEEPSADVTLILLQESGRPILPTIRSRCQQVSLAPPPPAQASDWLEREVRRLALEASPEAQQAALGLAGFAPGLALDYLRDGIIQLRSEALDAFRLYLKNARPLAEAVRPFKNLGHEKTLWLMDLWVNDLARIGAGGEPRDPDAADVLGYLARQNPAHRVHGLRDSIAESRLALVNNVNPEFEIDRLLIHWQGLMPRRRARQ